MSFRKGYEKVRVSGYTEYVKVERVNTVNRKPVRQCASCDKLFPSYPGCLTGLGYLCESCNDYFSENQ